MRFFSQVGRRVILLMGGPGTGKSLQASLCPDVNHVSTGELLRRIVERPRHPQSQRFQLLMEQGRLVSDDDLLRILKGVSELQSNQLCFLDGFPRTDAQWRDYKRTFGGPLGVIDFQLPREQMYQRLIMRNRMDDTKEAINVRLDTYFNQTLPLAKLIKDECRSVSFTIDASESVEKVHENFVDALDTLAHDCTWGQQVKLNYFSSLSQ